MNESLKREYNEMLQKLDQADKYLVKNKNKANYSELVKKFEAGLIQASLIFEKVTETEETTQKQRLTGFRVVQKSIGE